MTRGGLRRALVAGARALALAGGLIPGLVACGSSSAADAGTGFGDASVSSPDARVVHDAYRAEKDARRTDRRRDAFVDDAPRDAFRCTDAVAIDGAARDGALSPLSTLPALCAGLCGPVGDPCTGEVVLCGECPASDGGAPQACDLYTHTCGPRVTTCADLGAECGTIVTSCGTYLDCPDGPTKGCPEGEQCDPDTNRCEPCQPLTCADLGFQCGAAWLGCGPDTMANATDCGACPGTQRCNAVFNLCEPDCTPGSAAALCAAAGAQCGILTDGCGGTVDCDAVQGLGCAPGESCGVEGEANQCDPAVAPPECATVGRTCGTIVSACGSVTVSCGTCADGETCGAAYACCTPTHTLASYTALNQCGVALPDGCGNDAINVPCESPAAECVDNLTGGPGTTPPVGVVGSCCTPVMDCSAVPAGACASIPDSCDPTATLLCDHCASPLVCSGSACVMPSGGGGPTCPVGVCNITLTTDAGKATCACDAPLVCLCSGGACSAGEQGSCLCESGQVSPYTCEDVPDGPETGGPQCGMFSDGCGGTLTCACPVVANEPNVACTDEGECVCTPSTCDGQVGNGIPDGCGGTINCSG